MAATKNLVSVGIHFNSVNSKFPECNGWELCHMNKCCPEHGHFIGELSAVRGQGNEFFYVAVDPNTGKDMWVDDPYGQGYVIIGPMSEIEARVQAFGTIAELNNLWHIQKTPPS